MGFWCVLPLTLSWYFFSVDPTSLTAAHVYSPLSSGEMEARSSSVPSSRMDTPGSLPVSSWPLRNHRITGLGRPEGHRRQSEALWMRNKFRKHPILPLAGQGNAIRWFATLSCRGLLKGGSRTSTTGGTRNRHNQWPIITHQSWRYWKSVFLQYSSSCMIF